MRYCDFLIAVRQKIVFYHDKTKNLMANNIFDVILKTIGDVQSKNAANPKEETADPSIFDLLKEKLGDLDQKSRENRSLRGKAPKSIMDLIKKEIEGVRRQNKKDPNVATAPKSVFESILKKVEARPQRQASTGLKKVAEEYNLDLNRLPREVVYNVQQQYITDRKNFDKQYAQALFDLMKQYK